MAMPISWLAASVARSSGRSSWIAAAIRPRTSRLTNSRRVAAACSSRSEEHTSELQSPCNLVCRLLLEKKNVGERLVNEFGHLTLPVARPYVPAGLLQLPPPRLLVLVFSVAALLADELANIQPNAAIPF